MRRLILTAVLALTAPTTPPPTVTLTAPCSLEAASSEVSYPSSSTLQPGTPFEKVWRIENRGACDWPPGVAFALSEGEAHGAAPDLAGAHTSIWRLQTPDGTLFGIEPYVAITVPGDVTSTAPYPHISNITANTRQIWLEGQARDLPKRGLSDDGVHPPIPPDGNTADFTTLDYGYTMRNLLIAQALDALWHQVLSY